MDNVVVNVTSTVLLLFNFFFASVVVVVCLCCYFKEFKVVSAVSVLRRAAVDSVVYFQSMLYVLY
jgi:hypothetical protein